MVAQPPIEENPALRPVSDRLDSWKEIAAYLKRDVRTVQRWEEHEGLPVHRHLHRTLGSIYAYKSELDAWWHNHSSAIRMDSDAAPLAACGAPSATHRTHTVAVGEFTPATISEPFQQDPSRMPLSLPQWIRRNIPIPLWILFLFLIGGLVCTLLWGPGRYAYRPPVSSVYLSGNQLVALNSAGTRVWSHTYSHPPVASYLYPPTSSGTCHDEEADALVSVAWKEGESDELDCFSDTGSLMWSYRLNETLTFGTQTFNPPWRAQDSEIFRVNGHARIAVAMHHDVWWPSMVVLLDSQGRCVGTFVNSGWIYSLKALRVPSGMLLLIGGTSNSGDGAMFAVLDPAKLAGSSPERAGTIYECKSCGSGRPLKYFIFPRSEVNVVVGVELSFTYLYQSNGMILCRTQEARGSGNYDSAEGIVTFSPGIELMRAAYSDRYWEAHRQLEALAAIHHTRRECPDRFGPRRILSWDPQNGWKEIHPSSIGH